MVRTRQSARRCVGGTADRKPLDDESEDEVEACLVPDVSESSCHVDSLTSPVASSTNRTRRLRRADTSVSLNNSPDPDSSLPIAQSDSHKRRVSDPQPIGARTRRRLKVTHSNEQEETEFVNGGSQCVTTVNLKGGKGRKDAGKVRSESDAIGETEYIHDEFCYICQNGGDTLSCDTCHRSLCLKHVPAIQAVSIEEREKCVFVCPSCHKRRTVKSDRYAPYFGLYDKTGNELKPHFDNFVRLDVSGARPQHARVDTSPTVIICVRQAEIPVDGSPASVVHGILRAYYPGSSSANLHYLDLPFKIAGCKSARAYQAMCDRALDRLPKKGRYRVLLFIYAHSHDDTGDLFYSNAQASCSLKDWWRDVLSPRMQTLGEMHDVTLVMLSCGALVSHEATRTSLERLAERMCVIRMLAFSTDALQAALTVPFFVAYTHKILIEGAPLDDNHLGDLLANSLNLGRHSPLLLFTHENGTSPSFTAREYVWTHQTIRPNGHDLGQQCGQCGALTTRNITPRSGSMFMSVCKNPECGLREEYPPPAVYMMVPNREAGQWMYRQFSV